MKSCENCCYRPNGWDLRDSICFSCFDLSNFKQETNHFDLQKIIKEGKVLNIRNKIAKLKSRNKVIDEQVEVLSSEKEFNLMELKKYEAI